MLGQQMLQRGDVAGVDGVDRGLGDVIVNWRAVTGRILGADLIGPVGRGVKLLHPGDFVADNRDAGCDRSRTGIRVLVTVPGGHDVGVVVHAVDPSKWLELVLELGLPQPQHLHDLITARAVPGAGLHSEQAHLRVQDRFQRSDHRRSRRQDPACRSWSTASVMRVQVSDRWCRRLV